MKIFISYSSKQLEVAKRIKLFLDEIEIDSFLADDDIRTASDWKERIFEELQKCEIIIPVLSKEFKSSDWCSQELGIFYLQKKKIIPVGTDNIHPFGFINHIQSRFIKDTSLELIISEGLMECVSNCTGFIYLLKKLKYGFKIAEEIFSVIEPYFEKIKKEDVNFLLDVSIRNSQIWSSARCSEKYIPKLLELRKKDTDAVLRKKITYQIKNNKWYPN